MNPASAAASIGLPYPPIIGLLGPLGCGKTTTADALAARIGGRRVSCAGPIRDMLAALGVDREAMTARKTEPIPWLGGRTPRYLLQTLGTEWGRRTVHEDVWVEALLRRCDAGSSPVIVDDVRFDNEAAAIIRWGGQLVYLSRPGYSYTYTHLSECGLSDWFVVDAVLEMGAGVCHTGAVRLYLPPKRPWWANWAVGREVARLRARRLRTRFFLGSSIATPEECAAALVPVWDRLTSGRLTGDGVGRL